VRLVSAGGTRDDEDRLEALKRKAGNSGVSRDAAQEIPGRMIQDLTMEVRL
jgi:hypothetical protein